jgi:hypothetical protein
LQVAVVFYSLSKASWDYKQLFLSHTGAIPELLKCWGVYVDFQEALENLAPMWLLKSCYILKDKV